MWYRCGSAVELLQSVWTVVFREVPGGSTGTIAQGGVGSEFQQDLRRSKQQFFSAGLNDSVDIDIDGKMKRRLPRQVDKVDVCSGGNQPANHIDILMLTGKMQQRHPRPRFNGIHIAAGRQKRRQRCDTSSLIDLTEMDFLTERFGRHRESSKGP
jgi:hypothetical protein